MIGALGNGSSPLFRTCKKNDGCSKIKGFTAKPTKTTKLHFEISVSKALPGSGVELIENQPLVIFSMY